MKPTVAIMGYGMGNIASLRNAFEAIDVSVFIATMPAQLRGATHIVLPGVGAFPKGMEQLKSMGFEEPLRALVMEERRPLLGICLGMQLLASISSEQGHHVGLNWIPGAVERLPSRELKVPLMGWCAVKVRRPEGLFSGHHGNPTFYFVHSYHFVPKSCDVITSTCTYGVEFAASIQRQNIFGTQFHPEKSQKAGLALLRNFVNYTG